MIRPDAINNQVPLTGQTGIRPLVSPAIKKQDTEPAIGDGFKQQGDTSSGVYARTALQNISSPSQTQESTPALTTPAVETKMEEQSRRSESPPTDTQKTPDSPIRSNANGTLTLLDEIPESGVISDAGTPFLPAVISADITSPSVVNDSPGVNFAALFGVLSGAEQTPATIPGVRMNTDYSPEKLADLQDPSKVGAEPYGKGLVNTHHKGMKTVSEHEKAQDAAYAALTDKAAQGLVDPGSFGAAVCKELGVAPELTGVPKTHDQVAPSVTAELDSLVKSKAISPKEANLIKEEASQFIELYRDAYPDASPAKIFEVTRDNARKLAYQTRVDKRVFSGSDHGTGHILEGNMRFANQLIESLEKLGEPVSAKDKALIHQVIIDHDIGYTAGCAQAKAGYQAMKDHPLFSAKFVDENKDYYVDKFGADGYKVIRDSILYHSYVPDSPHSGSTKPDRINSELVRYATAAVDCMGVTAETKASEFFKRPDAVKTLLKMRMALEVGSTPDGKNLESLPPSLMDKYKQELMEIAGKEKSPERAEGYKNAIENFFTEVTLNNTLGQYTGVVDGLEMVRQEDGVLKPKINMHLSRVHALLGSLFGGKLETAAFAKAMEDFGAGKTEIDRLGQAIEQRRTRGIFNGKPIQFQSDKAVFEIAPWFGEDRTKEFGHVRGVLDDFYRTSVRGEINMLLDSFDAYNKAEGPEKAQAYSDFADLKLHMESCFGEKTTAAEARQLNELIGGLESADPEIAQQSRNGLKHFLTRQEQDFLGLRLVEKRDLGLDLNKDLKSLREQYPHTTTGRGLHGRES